MRPTCRKIENFLVGSEYDHKGRHIITVFLNAMPVTRFDADENAERRQAAIQLVELGLCTKTIAGEICGFHRNTVADLIKTKDLLGLEAVLVENRGRKEPVKYINEIQGHIRRLQENHPDWSDQKIANHAAKELNMEVSRNAVARIRIKHEPAKQKTTSKQELLDMAKVAEETAKEHTAEKQLKLPLELDPELKKKQEELADTKPPEAKTKIEEQLVKELQQGIRIPFAGELAHHLFLQEIGFEKLLSCYPYRFGSRYQAVDALETIFHSINLGFPSIESLKLANAGDLGLLIGQTRAPEKETLRDLLRWLSSYEQSSQLTEDLARNLLEKQRIDKEVFFIDGHFLPYYGLQVIAKGYYTVRRMALKGNELYAVTDLQGRPLFFLTESCEIDFRPMIARSAEMLIELGIQRPILVFDRGGYGVHFFKELDKQADFVTWAKHLSEKAMSALSDFTGLCLEGQEIDIAQTYRTIRETGQTAQNDGRDQPSSMEVRLVVVKFQKTGKYLGIYTNNRDKPAHEIVYYMLQRWGKSENFFKETLSWFNLDYHPGYDIKELEEQPMVDNPDIALIRKGIRALKNDIKELQKESELCQYKLGDRKDKRVEKKINRLFQEKTEKETELKRFENKLNQLPDKISILELLKGRPMNRCDLEKKKLYDLMQCLAFHSRERLVEILRDCYDDPRDIKQILGMITRRSGLLKLIGDTLVVILDGIDNKKYRKAADKFCRKLNEKEFSLVGRLKMKLSFYLNKIKNNKFEPIDNA